MRTVFALLLALAWSAVTAAQDPAPPPPPTLGEFGDGAATVHPEQIAPFDVEHYAITIDFDLEGRRITGDTSVTLAARDTALRSVALHFGNLEIERITDPDGATLTHRYDPDSQLLSIRLAEPLTAGASTTVRLRYGGAPAAGLTFTGPDDGYPAKAVQCWSQGQPEFNRYWFPCWDKPNDFATVETRFIVPAGFTAVGNGALVKTEARPATERTAAKTAFHWKQEYPHASYLTSVAIGRFHTERSAAGKVALEFHVPESWPEPAAAIRRSFGKTTRMLEFMHRYFGVPYPNPRYAQTCVLDFVAGGMENTSATTLTTLTLHDARAHLDWSSDDLVVHELAHQWFGDLVTCRDWSDIWLNEGFATYIEALWVRDEQGEDAYRVKLRDDLGWYWYEASSRYRRPVVTDRYVAPGEMFDGHSYSKAGRILAMLHDLVGEKAFRAACTRFITIHRHHPVSTDDLQAVFEHTSGTKLQWFFDQWCRAPGHPELEITAYHDPEAAQVRVTVTQVQERVDATPLFRLPVTIELAHGDERTSHRLVIDQESETFDLPCREAPDYVRFDPNGVLLAAVDFDRPVIELVAQLAGAKRAIGRIDATEALAERLIADGAFAAMARDALRTALGDRSKDVRAAACWSLAAFGARAVPHLLVALEDPESLVRRAAVEALAGAAYGDGDTAADHLTKLFAIDRSYSVRAACLYTLAELNADNARALALTGLATPSHRAVVQTAALEALFQAGEPTAQQRALAATRYGEDPSLIRGAIGVLQRNAGTDAAVIARLIALGGDPSFHTRSAAVRALGTLRTPEAVPMLQERLTTEPEAMLRAGARRALRRIADGPASVPEGK